MIYIIEIGLKAAIMVGIKDYCEMKKDVTVEIC